MKKILDPVTGLRFPDPREEAKARAEEFRRLTPEARWKEVMAMMALGHRMVQNSPKRSFIEDRWRAQEADWQKFQRELAKNA